MQEWYSQLTVADKGQLESMMKSIHRGLKRHGEGQVGVSFPHWSESGLGNVMYLVSQDEGRLTQVLAMVAREHPVSVIRPVPEHCERAIFARSRPHQRYAHYRRHGNPAGKKEAARRLMALKKVPMLNLASASNEQSFSIAVEMRSLDQATDQVSFNSYGLSSGLSVPIM